MKAQSSSTGLTMAGDGSSSFPEIPKTVIGSYFRKIASLMDAS